MGEFKVLLSKQTRTIKAVGKNKDEREATFGYIIHPDPKKNIKQFILSEAELIESAEDTNEKTIEINGEIFKPLVSNDRYYTTPVGAISAWLESTFIKTPPYDVTNLKQAIQLYEDAREMLNEIMSLPN